MAVEHRHRPGRVVARARSPRRPATGRLRRHVGVVRRSDRSRGPRPAARRGRRGGGARPRLLCALPRPAHRRVAPLGRDPWPEDRCGGLGGRHDRRDRAHRGRSRHAFGARRPRGDRGPPRRAARARLLRLRVRGPGRALRPRQRGVRRGHGPDAGRPRGRGRGRGRTRARRGAADGRSRGRRSTVPSCSALGPQTAPIGTGWWPAIRSAAWTDGHWARGSWRSTSPSASDASGRSV